MNKYQSLLCMFCHNHNLLPKSITCCFQLGKQVHSLYLH